jgi:hypothetical protein
VLPAAAKRRVRRLFVACLERDGEAPRAAMGASSLGSVSDIASGVGSRAIAVQRRVGRPVTFHAFPDELGQAQPAVMRLLPPAR